MLTSALPLPTEHRYGRMAGSAGLSVAVHVVILLLFSVATWAIHTSSDEPEQDYSVHAVAVDPPVGFTGGFRFPGEAMIDRPDRKLAGFSKETNSELAGLLADPAAKSLAPTQAASESGLGEILDRPLSRGDIVSGGGGGAGGSGGKEGGLGDSDFAGGGPVGTLWGVGQGQNARSVVYVMDRSGSMTDTFSLLQHELMRAIGS
ncbi:MAG TPA: hypothetical protein VMV81_08125, partial [Phycisphaerae bacterium]|nr:hypothetical protein [Phycisphaerae bacterium]